MEAAEYLGRSRLFRRLKSGPHGQLIERYAESLVERRLVRLGTWRSLNVVGGLLDWIASRRRKLTELDEQMIDRYLHHRSARQSIQPGDRPALERWLSVLREARVIPPVIVAPPTAQERIVSAFDDYLQTECGLALRSVIHYRLMVRRFLHETCPAGEADIDKLRPQDVIRYIGRHANDASPRTGQSMCTAVRAFLRYLHHRGMIAQPMAGCVPSVRRWKFASLPSHLPAGQVQKALDSCDRRTVIGRRDYAVLMLLAKLGLRADEVATLTLDDIDWRAGEMLVRAKGRQRTRMPMPTDVGTAIAAYLREGRPSSTCRRLFLRTFSPYTGFASGCAVTMIAKTALDRAGVEGCAHRGAHVFRHSLATELLRSGATLSEIGQLLRHASHDTTRIYAKVDVGTLRSLSQPWPGVAR